MSTSARRKAPDGVREALHELTNTLAAARMWLLVLRNAEPATLEAVLADSLPRLDRSIGDAEESCERLRQLLQGASSRRR
jgi:hypothetical protein